MKIVPLSEVKANLSRYGALCRHEPVVVTVNGTPSFQLMPISEDEDLIDELIGTLPEFRRQLESRRREKPLSWEEARGELGLSGS